MRSVRSFIECRDVDDLTDIINIERLANKLPEVIANTDLFSPISS